MGYRLVKYLIPHLPSNCSSLLYNGRQLQTEHAAVQVLTHKGSKCLGMDDGVHHTSYSRRLATLNIPTALSALYHAVPSRTFVERSYRHV